MKTPETFALCVIGNCPVADNCLRRQALVQMDAPRRDVITTINPIGLAPGADCPHFRSVEPIRIAYGFRGALSAIPHGNVGMLKTEISNHFCLRNYYHLRNGERSMTPNEQEVVAKILERYGATAPVRFDRYADDYQWF